MQVGIPWENVNVLDIRTLQDMANDGYEFYIEDGRIRCVLVTIRFSF